MQPCNCTSSRSALSRLVAVTSTADSICFSSFLFSSSPGDLISIPTLSFWILSSFLPTSSASSSTSILSTNLFSGPRTSDGNDRKEGDVIVPKSPNDRVEALGIVVLPLLPFLEVPTIVNLHYLPAFILQPWSYPSFPLPAFSSCVFSLPP